MRPSQIVYLCIYSAYFNKLMFYLKLIDFRGFRGRFISRRFSRELNFTDSEDFWQFAKISSREILFPRKFKPAKIKTFKVIRCTDTPKIWLGAEHFVLRKFLSAKFFSDKLLHEYQNWQSHPTVTSETPE